MYSLFADTQNILIVGILIDLALWVAWLKVFILVTGRTDIDYIQNFNRKILIFFFSSYLISYSSIWFFSMEAASHMWIHMNIKSQNLLEKEAKRCIIVKPASICFSDQKKLPYVMGTLEFRVCSIF